MRVTPLTRRLGSAALVLTFAVAAAGCSGGESEPSGSSSSATDQADDQADDGAESSGEGEASSEEPAGDVTELDAADFYPKVMGALKDAQTFRFESIATSAGQEQTTSGEARYDDDGIAMKASSTGAQEMEVILLDQIMYLKSADLGSADTWVKVDLSDPDSLFGMIGKATDPEAMFKAMEAPKKLELIGTEEVDGVDTNHYRITVDSDQYAAAMELPGEMAGMLPDELVTEMWVDGDDLPRKFTQTVETPSNGGQGVSSTTEGTYSDFGTDVSIEAPPADEVTENPFSGGA